MHIHLTRFQGLALAVLALGTTLCAEESEAHKKRTAQPQKTQPAPKVVSPKLNSIALSEILALNLTLQPGDYQQLFSKTDFTGTDTVNVSFFGTNDQDYSKTTYSFWWATPGAPNYVATLYVPGTNFAFLNSGGVVATTFGNQFFVGIQNNGTAPVTYIQVTLWATAR